MACFEVISRKIGSKEHFKLNTNEKEGTTNDISLSLDLINVKDSQNFYVSVPKPRLSVLGCLEQYNLNETSVLYLSISKFCALKSGVRLIYGCGLYTDVYGTTKIQNGEKMPIFNWLRARPNNSVAFHI